jgi:hypothetical protein
LPDAALDPQGLNILIDTRAVLIGRVMAMWLAQMSLSVAALCGFITRTGMATGNGILKVSHYINLCKFEGERFGQAKPPSSFALCCNKGQAAAKSHSNKIPGTARCSCCR